MEKEDCRHCVCLADDGGGEWICDEPDKPISEIGKCPEGLITAVTKARRLEVCPACGELKRVGLIVCWDCFKYRTDVMPLKPYLEKHKGTFMEWLKTIPANWKAKIARSGL